MCGFAGTVGGSPEPGAEVHLLRAMGRLLAARGPDGESLHADDHFRVVFRRLAVNDLTGGHQPFRSPDGRLTVVVNGEIYNHAELARRHVPGDRLRTRSDCEIVLHLFASMGTSAFAELNGMFSIAVWDAWERRLVLARDRLGVKPLYYAELGGRLVFASELRALLVHPDAPRSLDWDAFHDVPGLSFPYQRPAGRAVPSGVEGVEQVEPGCYVEWRPGRPVTGTRYWEPAGPSPDGAGDAAGWIERYAELLADSVRLRLMSDVPVGVFLSGGVDSALVAALAARHNDALEAFTLVEPSITAAGDPAAARSAARALGLPLHAVRVDADALASTIGLGLPTLEHLVWIMDFPVFDPEILFKHELHRYVAATRPDMKVVLLGQGADEFAGGYSRLGSSTWAEWTRHEAAALRRARARTLGIPAAFAPLVGARVTDAPPADLPASSPAWQAARFGDLAAHNLWHEDRTASASGRESRVPFLDHRLVELLCSVPPALHERLFHDKRIVRLVAERVLPASIAHRPKTPMYATGGRGGSIRLLRSRLIEASFGDFREKYLRADDTLFDERRLVELHDRAARAGAADDAAALLLRCMAIAVFERTCRDLARPGLRPPLSRALPCPLPAPGVAAGTVPAPESVPGAVPAEAAGGAAARPLPGAAFRPAKGVTLAVTTGPERHLLVIHGGGVVARVELAPDCPAARLDRLIRSPRLGLADLAAALGVSADVAAPVVEAFLARRWLVEATPAGCPDASPDLTAAASGLPAGPAA
ncbi:asparagine synthase (glutamine-hydrolyzing) [Sphaerisporangium fuscum]|uniref:asparagine synthase (glutamine-hydrolyzing) n=1 Tax=Sphaerisporangium fuscum TaxID=2835868 RepID=UPI001BDC2640|nr:asparagine synthase (glutamine-hydrolyzing) [Sphaerisporangium fuscum]